jgi:hypothetical protein
VARGLVGVVGALEGRNDVAEGGSEGADAFLRDLVVFGRCVGEGLLSRYSFGLDFGDSQNTP